MSASPTVAGTRSLGRAGIAILVGVVMLGAFLASSDRLALVSYLANAIVGAFLIAKQPRNVIGWILVVIAFGWVANSSYPGVDIEALIRGDASPRDTLIAWLNGWSGRAVFVGFLALAIVFPSGHLSVGRGRRIDIALLTVATTLVALTPFAPTLSVDLTGSTVSTVIDNPVGLLPGPSDAWEGLLEAADLAYIVLLSIGVGRLLLRYRRSDGVERLQFRWLVAAFGSILAAIAFGFLVTAVLGDGIGAAAWIPVAIAYSTIPIAIGIAVRRYRLFEIDRIISRTIAYGLISATLAAVFLIVSLVVTTAFSAVTGGDSVGVGLATLIVAALFTPLRGRVQRVVDHRFDRARYDAEQTTLAFSSRLRDEVDLPAVTADLDATIRRAIAPSALGIWLRADSK